MADSERKLCRWVSEFDTVCGRRKFRVNVGRSKVMRFSKLVYVDRMDVRLNGGQLEEFSCFEQLGSQVAGYGGSEMAVVHRINDRY